MEKISLIYHTKFLPQFMIISLSQKNTREKQKKKKEDQRRGRAFSSLRSKLLLAGALARVALRLRHLNALLDTLLLADVVLGSDLRRNSVGLSLAQRVLCVGVPALGVRTGHTLRISACVFYNAVVDLVAGLVDKARTSLVASGEGDFAFHGLDLFFVEKVAVLVAELDLLLGDGAFGDDLLLAGSGVDVLLGVFGDGWGRTDVCLRSGCRAGGGDVFNGVFGVLE